MLIKYINQAVALLSATTAFFFLNPIYSDGLKDLDLEVSLVLFFSIILFVWKFTYRLFFFIVPRVLGRAWI
jgi:hypothetical protein